jgi:hypothetical protein
MVDSKCLFLRFLLSGIVLFEPIFDIFFVVFVHLPKENAVEDKYAKL